MSVPDMLVLAQPANSGGWLDFLHTMKGPQFLGLYAVWFSAVFVTVLVLRWRGYDTAYTTFAGIAAFLGLGIARMVAGSAHGMHKWEFLILMMFVGVICFLVRVENLGGGSSDGGSWWSNCSTGGGCGGGGCGGGGCGGCGGS